MVEEERDKVKRLVEFRKRLDTRISEVQMELDELMLLKEFLDSTLLEKGFKQAKILEKPQPAVEVKPFSHSPSEEQGDVVPLKTFSGVLLANLRVGVGFLEVEFTEDRDFHVDTPPFKSFLVDKVLEKMRQKDSEASTIGETPVEKVFSYNVESEGGILRRIVMKNVDERRLKELKSSVRWTLEKMFEKSG